MRFGLDRTPPLGWSGSHTCVYCTKEITDTRIYRDQKGKPFHRNCLSLVQQKEKMDEALRGTFNGA